MSHPSNLDPHEHNGIILEEPPKAPQTSVRQALKPKPSVAPSTPPPEPEEDEETFFERNKALLIVGPIVVAAVVWFAVFRKPGTTEPVRKAPEQKMVMVQLPPPPPPPPPPKIKPPEPPKDVKRQEQTPTEKPVENKPIEKPAEKPPEGLGTNNKGPGPGMAGLGSSGNGVIGGTGSGTGGGGSAARWYAGQLQGKVSEALRANPKTRKASLRVDVKLWVDDSGKVVRSEILGGTGDPAIDAALKSEILANIRLSEGPPKNMKMPVSLRLTVKRPG